MVNNSVYSTLVTEERLIKELLLIKVSTLKVFCLKYEKEYILLHKKITIPISCRVIECNIKKINLLVQAHNVDNWHFQIVSLRLLAFAW